MAKVGKVPTSDSQFRFLEDRTKVSITDRSFQIDGGQTLAAPGGNTTVLVDMQKDSADATVPWLIKGMVVQFAQNKNTIGDANEPMLQGTGRVESVTHNSTDTSLVVKTKSLVEDSIAKY